MLGKLLVGGRPLQAVLELGHRALNLTGAGSYRARHPIEGAQLVEDGALDPVHRIGLEFVAAGRFELVDGVDQPEGAVGDEVRRLHVARQARAQTAGDELDQRGIVEDQALAGSLISGLLELFPELGDFVFAALRRGGGYVHKSS